jgi:DTW domain-containing protein YfiP
MASTKSKRELCERCARPLAVCICQYLPSVKLDTVYTHVVILQHSNEKKNRQAISSVPLLNQVMSNSSASTFVLDQWTLDEMKEGLEAILLHPSIEIVFILFPHIKAKTLTKETVAKLTTGTAMLQHHEQQQQQQKKFLLVALDGTWKEAKQMMHRSQERLLLLEEELSIKGRQLVYVCLDDQQITAQSCYGALRK